MQGLGLGAEIVVGYSTLTEFVPPKTRGRWLSFMAFLVVAGFPATALLGYLIIPSLGLAADVHHRRHRLADRLVSAQEPAESPRWLEAQGRTAEAEALMQSIEKRGSPAVPLPPPATARRSPQLSAAAMFRPPILQRMIVGAWVLITINTLIFGFVIFLPQFFLRQGLTITQLARLHAGAVGGLADRLCARRLELPTPSGGAGASSARRSSTIVFGCDLCALQRRVRPGTGIERRLRADRRDLCADRDAVRRLHAELFPTEIRLRANGICNTLGRGATVVSPFVVGSLMASYKFPGVIWLMIILLVVQIVAVIFLGGGTGAAFVGGSRSQSRLS